MDTVQLSLISHTNVGKTTLARTLLRQDVGEVLDRAHVTQSSEAYELIADAEARLLLWDTPGFGDSSRLLKRLRNEQHPVLWLLQQTWDRLTDRPFWSSQQAVRTIRDQSDAVLYLVNAAEDPAGAGYAGPELELLTWVGRPVLLLLNQTGPPGLPLERVEQVWRSWAERWPVVQDVLSLDAFTRCWVQEGLLLERVARLLPPASQPAMARLADAWQRRNLEVFADSMGHLAAYLAGAAVDREALPSPRPRKAEGRRAMEALAQRLETETRTLMDRLIAGHGLEGRSEARLQRQLDDFLLHGTSGLTAEKGALLGGALTGALGGLAADLLAGGLTFGGGMVAGAILGALGGAGLSRAYDLFKLGGEPAAGWSPDFLLELVRQSLLRYLAVAHFGRGRGSFQEDALPPAWQLQVDDLLAPRESDLRAWFRQLSRSNAARTEVEAALRPFFADLARTLLVVMYPSSPWPKDVQP